MDLRKPIHILRFYFHKKEYSKPLLLTSCLVVLNKIFAALAPFCFLWTMNSFESPQGIYAVLAGVLLYISVRCLSAFCGDGKDVFFVPVEQAAITEMAQDLFCHVQQLGVPFHAERRMGGLIRIIERGIRAVENFSKFFLFNILPAGLELLIACSLLAYSYTFFFSLVLALTLMAYTLYTLVITKNRMDLLQQITRLDHEKGSQSLDTLLNIITVKSFTQEKDEEEKHKSFLNRMNHLVIRQRLGLMTLNIGQIVILSVGLGILLAKAAIEVKAGHMSIADFVVMNGVLLQFIMPLHALGFATREVKQSWIDMKEMGKLWYLPTEIADEKKVQSLQVTKGEICFENVSFGYTPDRPILKNVSFSIAPGSVVAFVGSSGVGKTTLFSLLLRFVQPDTGRILIDNQDISLCSRLSIRQALGLVFQDTMLFNDTIRNNLIYGRKEVCQKDIDEAVKIATLEPLIERLPQGYETMVGERGIRLSGGERQRLSIARLMIRCPRIFLFDEATSAVDTLTQREIHNNVKAARRGRTTLIVSHRLSVTRDVDKIFVFENGNIVQQGSHEELLQEPEGLYARLWQENGS